MDDSLTHWMIGAVGTGMLTTFGLLVRGSVMSFTTKLSEVVQDIKRIADSVNSHEQRLALGAQSFASMREDVSELKRQHAKMRAFCQKMALKYGEVYDDS